MHWILKIVIVVLLLNVLFVGFMAFAPGVVRRYNNWRETREGHR